MRLSKKAQIIIRNTVTEIFGADAQVYLFGSRVDDTAKGGDIDLLIRLDRQVQARERKALTLVARLQLRMGDQPIDVVVQDPQTMIQSIHRDALRTGVRLE